MTGLFLKKYIFVCCAVTMMGYTTQAQSVVVESAGAGVGLMDLPQTSHMPTPEENAKAQAAAAEWRKQELLKKEEQERLRKLAKRTPQLPPPPKPYVILQKYSFATPQVYGYINLGDGKGNRDVSETEYRVLTRQYVVNPR